MSEFILVHYKPDHPSGLLYWAMGADHHPSITLAHGELEELARVARGRKVYVLIDAHYTMLESVKVPSKSRHKQLQAIPFAMEDHLAEDIDNTHFALGKPDQNHQIPVIAIKRSLMQNTLERFAQHQVSVDAISADSIAIPGNPEQWCVLIDEDSALIKLSDSQAHCCDRENTLAIIQALLAQSDTPPASILYHYKEGDDVAESLLDSLDVDIETRPYKSHSLEIFATHIKEALNFNLLQGEFKPKKKSSPGWLQPWKSVAAVAGLWMVLHLGHAAIASMQLKQKNQALSKQIEQEFKRAMPEARKMTNMQTRVERKLEQLKTGSTANTDTGFLQILGKATPALAGAKNIEIRATVYRNNYIDIDMSAASLQDIEQLKNSLNSLSGIKTVLSTTVEKDKVQGRLRLEAGQ